MVLTVKRSEPCSPRIISYLSDREELFFSTSPLPSSTVLLQCRSCWFWFWFWSGMVRFSQVIVGRCSRSVVFSSWYVFM